MAFTFGNSSNTGSSAFGSNNNTGGAFGGFGSNNNNSNNNSSLGGFGSNSNSGGLFGNNNNNSKSIFGSTNNTSTGAFGSNNAGTSIFGGGNPSGSMFGSNNNTTGTTNAFGSGTTLGSGFGGTFGSSTTTNSGGLFGNSAAKPSLFGAGGAGTTGGFGASTSAFGSGTALGQNVPECQGTGSTPFVPYEEKEANGKSVFQTITFMQPYQNYSLEELRLADYNAGRRFGNGSGQAGAFGATNFGSAFGSNNNNASGGLFGSTNNNNNTSPFGANNTATTGAFGANNNTSGGLFGGGGGGAGLFGSNNSTPKPAGLFGSGTTGGAFGSNNNTPTTGAFGSGNNTGGGLFGNNATGTTGGLFGSNAINTTTPSTGFSFGGTNNNNNSNNANTTGTGGLFGSTNTTQPSGGLFGGTNTTNNSGGGLFGGASNNNNTNTGGLFGGKPGAFGTNTNTSTGGGLFGTNNTNTTGSMSSGGLFGNTNTNNSGGGGLFGNPSTNTNATGGLFGNTQQKSGGLFSNPGSSTNGGGLFGTTQNNNASTGGGLFGNPNASQQGTGGGLFGNTTSNSNSLFGNPQNQQKSLFGTPTNNSTGGGLFGTSMSANNNNTSLFGASQPNQPQSQQGEVKYTSLLDPNPYGQSSIWTGLPTPTQDNSKPLFTPLTATKKLEEAKIKPLQTLKLNQSRYMTPPRRQGYGLSYSTYGTPNSAASTPGSSVTAYGGARGFSGGSFGRSFSRSSSVQNLRSSYSNDADNVWNNNAFGSSHRHSGGSIKRLTIDRSIRPDLFKRPDPVPALPALGQKDQFDDAAENHDSQNGEVGPERKLSKRVSFENGLNSNTGALVRTEVDDNSDDSPPQRSAVTRSHGKELAAVPEDHESHQVSSKPTKSAAGPDPEPGDYWMKPSRSEMKQIPQEQLKSYTGFEVGRHGCGFVRFEMPVDLTKLTIDDIPEKIVHIRVRAITVYPEGTNKPPVGKGLNVPSTITLEHSWPRSRGQASSAMSGAQMDKHISRLSKIQGTEFVNYDKVNGRWTFKVPHYTRYALDYDDDDDMTMDQSELTLPPISFGKSTDTYSKVASDKSSEARNTRKYDLLRKPLPGNFEDQSMMSDDIDEQQEDDQSSIDNRSHQSAYSEDESMSQDDTTQSMPGSMPVPNQVPRTPPKQTSQRAGLDTPGRPLLDLDGDWAEQLQRTISPRKQDRAMLREAQSKVLLDEVYSPIKPKTVPKVAFKSSMDIMNSIFPRKSVKKPDVDFEFPYAKRAKTSHDGGLEMTAADQAWHKSFKPYFTNAGELVSANRTRKHVQDRHWEVKSIAREDTCNIFLLSMKREIAFNLEEALSASHVEIEGDVPRVRRTPVPFSKAMSPKITSHELPVYNLAHILFDDYEDEYTRGLTGSQQKQYMSRIRRDRLKDFVAAYIKDKHAGRFKSAEKENTSVAALLHLTTHDIEAACEHLKYQKNYNLLLLIARLDTADEMFMNDIRKQINAWRDQKALSEMTDDIRALYEICAGNVSIAVGKDQSNVPVEDRAVSFEIAERFQLDWLQCFALGLFYGFEEKTHRQNGIAHIEDAVLEFSKRISQRRVTITPGDDPLWTLLKLYAVRQKNSSASIESISKPIFPTDLLGLAQSWDTSALFTFSQTIAANLGIEIDHISADALTAALAQERLMRKDLVSTIFVLLHLSDSQERAAIIKETLIRCANLLPSSAVSNGDNKTIWESLVVTLQIPASWLLKAKAQYAASARNDNLSELRYLIEAESWQEAHTCLVKRVAPILVINNDWYKLIDITDRFTVNRDEISDWHNGGGLFADFAEFMLNKSLSTTRIDSVRRRIVALGRAQSSKKIVQPGQLAHHDLAEYVSVREMADHLAQLRSSSDATVGTLKELLDLPLNDEVRNWIEQEKEYEDGRKAGKKPNTTRQSKKLKAHHNDAMDVAEIEV